MSRWVTRRGAVLVALLLVLAVGVGWVLVRLTASNDIRYDPANPGARGAEAVASVLADQGVRVHRVSAIPEAIRRGGDAQTSVLVSDPRSVSAQRLRELAAGVRGAARLILVAPSSEQLAEAFDLPDDATYFPGPTASGECDLGWGQDLSMPANSTGYTAPADAASCFTDSGYSAAYEAPANGSHPALLVLGSSRILANSSMKLGDNAAIGLRALGQNPQLVWVSGTFDPNSTTAQEDSPWPTWLSPALWLLAAATVLLMLWRGRRLGRLVSEPLPVIVPANETTVARGQLYRRARDTTRTAQVLRSATRTRLRGFLGLPPGTPDVELVRRVAAQTGRSDHEVGALLGTDPHPMDEHSLSTLAQELSALERQARH